MGMSWLFLVYICLATACKAENVLRNNTKTGQLEIFYKNQWRGMVGNTTLGLPLTDYKVLCKTLGMPSDNAGLARPGYQPKPSNPVFLNLTCLGNETSITDCPVYDVEEKTSVYFQPFFMRCYDLKFKLAFGPIGNVNYGVVEKLFGHKYFPVCPEKFVDDRRFAQVVCREMGLNSTHAVAVYRDVPLQNRTYGANMVLNCSDHEPASQCSIHTDDFHTFCRQPTSDKLGTVYCTNDAPKYRLTNVDNSTGIGRLEISFNEKVWAAVCATIDDDAFATVACKSLGLPSTNAQSFPYRFMGNAISGGIYEAYCTGNESLLEECRARWARKCEDDAFLGLSCSEATQWDLRLNSLKLGRLQIYNKEQWLGISIKDSVSSGLHAVRVICRSLNMSTIAVTGTISNKTENCWLSVDQCSGNESSIMDCGNTTIAKSPFQCQPLTVTCGDGEENLRIAEDGKLEFRLFGVWGSINAHLKKDFLNYAVSLVCKFLNKPSTLASVWVEMETPARTGPIWYTGLECGKDAKSLVDCFFKNNGPYNHDNDVYINCQELNVSSVKYGLSKMEVPEVGIPKMRINGEWGLFCNDWLTFLSVPVAQVLCRSMGMRSDGARYLNMYKGYTPSVDVKNKWFNIGQITCTGKEDTILNCSHGYPGDVGDICLMTPIYCGAPQEIADYTVRLVDGLGEDDRSGRLEMMMFNHWGTICDEGFSSKDASAVCHSIDKVSTLNSSVATRGFFRKGTGKIWPLDLQCAYGSEEISECIVKPKVKKNCTHAQDVGVICKVITPDGPKGLGIGPILGISFGSVGGLIVIVVGVWLCYKRRMTRGHEPLN